MLTTIRMNVRLFQPIKGFTDITFNLIEIFYLKIFKKFIQNCLMFCFKLSFSEKK